MSREFLHDVLHGEDARGSAVFVHHHSQVSLAADEFSEDVLDPHRLGHDDGRVKETGDIRRRLLALRGRQEGPAEHILGMDVTDDVVDVTAEGHHLAQPGLGKATLELGDRVHLHGHDLVARHEAVPGFEVGEVEGILKDLELVVEFRFLFRIHPLVEAPHIVVEVHSTELLFAVGIGLAPEENPAQRQDHQRRREQEVVDGEEGDRQDAEPAVGGTVEEPQGQEFRGDQHDHRGDRSLDGQGGQRRRGRFPIGHLEEELTQQGAGLQAEDDEGEVVAHQHGGDELLRAAQQVFHDAPGNAPAVPVQFRLQSVRRDIRDFHAREEGRGQKGQEKQG